MSPQNKQNAFVLGIDTSNYTTSCALLNLRAGEIWQQRQLLPVKPGEAGIRQSDAVFHHVRQLPALLKTLFFAEEKQPNLVAVGVSTRPTAQEGSYMPCFLAGEASAVAIAAAVGLEPVFTTHQHGHIVAALYSCGKLDLLKKKQEFYAFHVSGGTTDAVLCQPQENSILHITPLLKSLDLKAGQAIDRTGLRLGLQFPCGQALEQLALQSAQQPQKIKIRLKNGNCCLSGLENLCETQLKNGVPPADIARFCLDFIGETLAAMTDFLYQNYGERPILFAGGVMSNTILKEQLSVKGETYFAQPEFSRDNAAGVAVAAAIYKGLM